MLDINLSTYQILLAAFCASACLSRSV